MKPIHVLPLVGGVLLAVNALIGDEQNGGTLIDLQEHPEQLVSGEGQDGVGKAKADTEVVAMSSTNPWSKTDQDEDTGPQVAIGDFSDEEQQDSLAFDRPPTAPKLVSPPLPAPRLTVSGPRVQPPRPEDIEQARP